MSAEILVAEDNALNFELMRDVLTAAGHRVTWARDGEEAVAELGDRRYDLLMLDLHMPRLDGLAVLERIRSRPELLGLPVMVVSADAMGDIAAEVISAGADAYLAKPLDIVTLLGEVDRLLGDSKAG